LQTPRRPRQGTRVPHHPGRRNIRRRLLPHRQRVRDPQDRRDGRVGVPRNGGGRVRRHRILDRGRRVTLTIYDQLEQGTDEWLEARRGIITASTVGKLLTSTGKVANNDTSRALTETLVAERLSGQIDNTPPTRDMQRGTILEAFSRDIYTEHYGPVAEIGFGKLETPTYTIGASPDGLVSDDGGFETKSPRPRTHLRTI